MTKTAPQEGRRERKKRETRERISDLATGLFLERGFDAVTVAEIAEAADVSVNTVYNYFPAKEDLFLDREEEIVDRLPRMVRERTPGESAVAAVLGRLRAEAADHHVYAGLAEGYDVFNRRVNEAPTLLARVMLMHHRMAERMTETLRAETGAEPGDALPELVGGALVNLSNGLFRSTTDAVAEGVPVDRAARQVLQRIDTFESLCTDVFLNYATKPAEGE